MEEGELLRLTWNAGNAKEESLTFEWDMTLSRLFENPNQESERHVHIVSDKALVHFKYVFRRVKFVNTLK